jgi:hypothetical protein
MYWRKPGIGLIRSNPFLLSNLILLPIYDQFSFGGLAPSSDLLRTIEEVAADNETKLQSGFEAHGKCSSKSII